MYWRGSNESLRFMLVAVFVFGFSTWACAAERPAKEATLEIASKVLNATADATGITQHHVTRGEDMLTLASGDAKRGLAIKAYDTPENLDLQWTKLERANAGKFAKTTFEGNPAWISVLGFQADETVFKDGIAVGEPDVSTMVALTFRQGLFVFNVVGPASPEQKEHRRCAGVMLRFANQFGLFDEVAPHLLVYPSMRMDESVVEVVSSKTYAGDVAMLSIEEGYPGACYFHSEAYSYANLLLDEYGGAKVALAYRHQSMADLEQHPRITITAILPTSDGSPNIQLTPFEIDVKENWDSLLMAYKTFPGAKANPCINSLNKMTGMNLTNGPWVDIFETMRMAGLDLPPGGTEHFVCGDYQHRIYAWLLKRRFDKVHAKAARMNGISFLPYTMLGGLHRFVGVCPAGYSPSAQSAGTGVLFLDPWWKQMGPQTFSKAEEVGLMAQCAARMSVGMTATGLTVGAASGAVGLTQFAVTGSMVKAFAALDAFLVALESATSRVSFGWDETLDNTVDVNRREYQDAHVNVFVDSTPLDFDAPAVCVGVTDIFKSLARGVGGAVKALVWKCPVSVELSDTEGHSFRFNQNENTITGDLAAFAMSFPEGDGSRALLVLADAASLHTKTKAERSGTFTLCSAQPGMDRIASYTDVAVHAGDVFELDVEAGTAKPMLAPDGTRIPPVLRDFDADLETQPPEQKVRRVTNLKSINNGAWNDVTPALSGQKELYFFTDNKYGGIAEITLWVLFESAAQLELDAYPTPWMKEDAKCNQGAKASMTSEVYVDRARLSKALEADGPPRGFMKGLVDGMETVAVCRIHIQAPDRGHHASYRLSADKPFLIGMGRAKVDVSGGPDVGRARVGAIIEAAE